MKNIKILSAGLASAMIFLTGVVFAENEVLLNEPVLSGKTVTISGNVSAPNEKIYIEVTRKGSDILDEEKIYAAYQVTSNENGEFSFEYNMPEMSREDNTKYSDGYFKAYAYALGYDEGSVEFTYVSERGKERFFEELNGSMSSENSLYGFFVNEDNGAVVLDEENVVAFLTYGVLIDEIGEYSEASLRKLCKLMVDSGYVYNEENISQINECIYLMRLNGITDKAKAEEVLRSEEIAARCNPTYEDAEFDTLEGELLDWYLKLFVLTSEKNGFDSFEQVEELFKEAYILNDINKAHYSDLYDVLYENRTELDLTNHDSFLKTGRLSDNKKQSVMKELKEESGEFVRIADVKEAIEKAYESYNRKVGAANQDGGGSNTSGGGKSSVGSFITGNSGANANQDSKKEAPEGKSYFSDIENYGWAEEYINKLAANGIISGNGNGEFEPERKVTRAEFLKMLLGALELVSEDAQCSFEDVSKADWSYPYIASAYAQGITSGIDDKNFGKDNLITRQEAAVFMHRGAVRTFIPMEQKQNTEFADSDKIASWANRSINILCGAGLISGVGDNRFEPEGYTTRAQAAKMVCSLFDLL